MRFDDTLNKLYQNRLMRDLKEIESFENALVEAKDIPDEKYIESLYNVFDDETKHHEVMWGLIHLIESFDNVFGSKITLKALAYATPNILLNANEWAKIIYYRILNHEPSRVAFSSVIQDIEGDVKDEITYFLRQVKASNENQFGESVDFILK